MESLSSKVAYIEELVQNLNMDTKTNEGKVILQVLDVLKSMSVEIENLKDAHKDVEEYLDAIDEELVDIESYCFDYDEEQEYDEIKEEDFIKLMCPHCSEIIYIDKKIYNDKSKITCPNCQKVINFKQSNTVE